MIKQGSKSRCVRALVCALAALAAMAAAIPAAAAAAPAAAEEYDLVLPDPNGGNEPTSAPPAEPPVESEAPAAPPAAAAPTETAAPTSEEADRPSTKPQREPAEQVDQAAIRRDVLFERPDTVAAPTSEIAESSSDDGGLPILLLALIAIGGFCIVATMVRLRRFAGAAAKGVGPAAPHGASGSQSG